MTTTFPHAGAPGMIPGELREALRTAVAALDAAERGSSPLLRCETLAHVGRCYRAIGDAAPAAWYLQQALRGTRDLGHRDAVVDLLCELAELAMDDAEQADIAEEGRPAHAARERARDHGFEAARLAERASDAQWEISVLLRVSDVLERCGDHDDAIGLQCRALDLIVRTSGMPVATPRH
jgi:hypothetical protein